MIVYEVLIHVSTYEFLPSQEIYSSIMDLPDQGYLNEKFDRLDYGSFYTSMNLGTVFPLLLWLLSLYPIYIVLLLLKRCLIWPSKLVKKMHSLLFWKQLLIFTYATFLELSISILL